VALFGKEAGLYKESAQLLVALLESLPEGVTTAERVDVMLLLQEMYWRHKVAPPNGEDKGKEAKRLLELALGLLLDKKSWWNLKDRLQMDNSSTDRLGKVYNGLGLVDLIFRNGDDSNDDHIKKNLQTALDLRLRLNSYADAGETLNALGTLAQKMKDYTQAEHHFIRSLELRQKVLSENNANMAQSYTSMGTLNLEIYQEAQRGRRDKENLHKAKQFFTKAKCVYVAVYGPEHPRAEMALIGLAKVQEKLKDLEGCKETLEMLAPIQLKRGASSSEAYFQTRDKLNVVTAALESKNQEQIPSDNRTMALSS